MINRSGELKAEMDGTEKSDLQSPGKSDWTLEVKGESWGGR
jgi:hypothetical protein